MRESEVENYLVKEVKRQKGMAMKFVSPGLRGVPDRIVLMEGGKIIFVELKAPGEKPRKQQEIRIAQLKSLGFRVKTIDTKKGVDELMREMTAGAVNWNDKNYFKGGDAK